MTDTPEKPKPLLISEENVQDIIALIRKAQVGEAVMVLLFEEDSPLIKTPNGQPMSTLKFFTTTSHSGSLSILSSALSNLREEGKPRDKKSAN